MLALLSLVKLPRLTDSSLLRSKNAKKKTEETHFGSLERSNTTGQSQYVKTRKENSIRRKRTLADEGSLREEGGGYTFFWKGSFKMKIELMA